MESGWNPADRVSGALAWAGSKSWSGGIGKSVSAGHLWNPSDSSLCRPVCDPKTFKTLEIRADLFDCWTFAGTRIFICFAAAFRP